MLTHLSITNIVLVDTLSLDLTNGLTTLTGETGAGKSILLDAIGLVIGGRGDSTLVRHGTEKASVTASFEIFSHHPIWKILDDMELAYDTTDPLLLRRTINKDGKSRAFVNNIPTTIRVLKTIGDSLIDVQGQFEQHGLLSPKTHLDILDSYAGILTYRAKLHSLYDDWQSAFNTYKQTVNKIKQAKIDAEYITHCLSELNDLNPQIGEYERLQIQHTELKNATQLLNDYNTAHALLDGDDGILTLLSRTERSLDKIVPLAGDKIQNLVDTLISANESLTDVAHTIEQTAHDTEHNAMDFEKVADRMHLYNTLIQKHRTDSDGLVTLHMNYQHQHRLIGNSDSILATHLKQLRTAYTAYMDTAIEISEIRIKTAKDLGTKVSTELPALALKGAEFFVNITHTQNARPEHPYFDTAAGSRVGIDTVVFTARINAGGAFSPIHKSASGGELSRLLLAINVVLSHTNTALTLMFDEIDAGVGGSSADKIGNRLLQLAATHQVLVITHSPQVASAGNTHLFVEKTTVDNRTVSHITTLSNNNRICEIARMLSGNTITDHAINNAKSLLGVS